MSDTFRGEVAAATCEGCTLRTMPEDFWKQNRRDNMTPYELGQEVADQVDAVAAGVDRGIFMPLEVIAQALAQTHDQIVELHSCRTFNISVLDDEGHIDGDKPRHLMFAPTPIAKHAKREPVENLGAGMVAFLGCYRAIVQGTCTQVPEELKSQSAEPSSLPDIKE